MNEGVMIFAKPVIIFCLSFCFMNGLIKVANRKGAWSDVVVSLLSSISLLFAAWI